MAKKTYLGINGVAEEIPKGYIGIDGVARKIKKVYIGDENGKAKECWSSLEIVSWATGTDEQIAAMVAASDAGVIDLYDYWSVGDERKVRLSAITSSNWSYGEETHSAQTVTFVLMNKGGKTLASGGTCKFVVGLKNCLSVKGWINFADVSSGGFPQMSRRGWYDTDFRNAIPATLRGIFKQHINYCNVGDSSVKPGTIGSTVDYFAPPAVVEVLGNNGNYSMDGEGTQFEWYKTTANQLKKLGDSGSKANYWTRSKQTYNNTNMCLINTNGVCTTTRPSSFLGLTMFGCI